MTTQHRRIPSISPASAGLSAWLGATAERDIGHRRFTVTEYGEWSIIVRAMELARTGTHSEFRSAS